MHHITYQGKTVVFPAKDISTVLKLIQSLKDKGIEYNHIFWE